MVLDNSVSIKWNKRNKSHYVTKGYEFIGIGKVFVANIADIQQFSSVEVNVLCDICNHRHKAKYRDYNHKINLYSKYICSVCLKNNRVGQNFPMSIGEYIVGKFENAYENPLRVFWSQLNHESAFNVKIGARTTHYFTCPNGHPPYKTKPLAFAKGHRCPYCVGQKATLENSFAVHHVQNTSNDFLALHWDFDKNTKNPFELTPYSSSEAWFKCIDNPLHESYNIVASQFTAGRRCPKCAKIRHESHLQEKVRRYIVDELGYTLNHEECCSIVPVNPKTKYPLPFDNEVVELRLIIEVHGKQHFEECAYLAGWVQQNLTPKEALKKRKAYDRYKKYVAYKRGYDYLVIPYYLENGCKFKKIIDNKISEIVKSCAVHVRVPVPRICQ